MHIGDQKSTYIQDQTIPPPLNRSQHGYDRPVLLLRKSHSHQSNAIKIGVALGNGGGSDGSIHLFLDEETL